MSRIPNISIDDFNEEQKAFFKNLTQGRRGKAGGIERFLNAEKGVRGPFNAWFYSPKLGDAAQRMGEMLRFEGALSDQLRELAILVVAAEWEAQYEWWAHSKIAKAVGLDDDTIASIKEGRKPVFDNPDYDVVYDFALELIKTRNVTHSLYDRVIRLLGESKVVELVMLIGYYTLVSMTINVFQVPLPEGEYDLKGIVDENDQ